MQVLRNQRLALIHCYILNIQEIAKNIIDDQNISDLNEWINEWRNWYK
jgi:hypothetical protein